MKESTTVKLYKYLCKAYIWELCYNESKFINPYSEYFMHYFN